MSREEIEGLGSLLEDAADALRYEDWPFAATSVEKAAQALTTLLAENKRLREALAECADDLEAEITARADGELPRRIARDMETVTRARAALNKDPDQ